MGACFCIGPQNGQPLCPCRMRGVIVQDGRYVEVRDHGPVQKHFDEIFLRVWEKHLDEKKRVRVKAPSRRV